MIAVEDRALLSLLRRMVAEIPRAADIAADLRLGVAVALLELKPFNPDAAAEAFLRVGLRLLPDAPRMQRAARAGLTRRGAPPIDDEALLIRMGRLIVESCGQMKPMTAANKVKNRKPVDGWNANDGGKRSLYDKYTKDPERYLRAGADWYVDDCLKRAGVGRSHDTVAALFMLDATLSGEGRAAFDYALIRLGCSGLDPIQPPNTGE